jgi:hypothetical protein
MPNAFRFTALILMTLGFSAGIAAAGEAGSPAFSLEVEAGSVWQTVNDVQIPNTSAGTRFSLVDLAGKGPQFAFRTYLTWRLNEKHSLRGLFAPLSFTEPGTPTEPINFNGSTFPAGQEVLATYKFNSYRLTYSYRWHHGEKWSWDVGFTAKIRDAKIQIQQGAVTSTKDDLGFVPLLHLAGHWRMSERWHLLLDLDALAGGPGRAEDLAIKLGYDLAPNWHLRAGYRTVEGGADVEEVYNFAWLHYAVMSLAVDF